MKRRRENRETMEKINEKRIAITIERRREKKRE